MKVTFMMLLKFRRKAMIKNFNYSCMHYSQHLMCNLSLWSTLDLFPLKLLSMKKLNSKMKVESLELYVLKLINQKGLVLKLNPAVLVLNQKKFVE